jgi:CelD/BcsL family acetyltransferase involved in cellulose biosynthesis
MNPADASLAAVASSAGRRGGDAPIVERIDRIEGFRCVKSAWESIYRRDPESQFFLSWTWLAGVFEAHPGAWFVLVARDAGGEYLGFLPLYQKAVWSKSRNRIRNEIEFAGRLFWADYGGVLCLPGCEDDVLPAFARHLKRMDWSHIYLKGFRVSDRRYELFMGPFADDRLAVESLTARTDDGESDNLVSPYVDLPDTFERYLVERLSSNTRQKVRRYLRKVESSLEYRLTVSTPATHGRDVRILEDLWRTMWGSLKGSRTDRLAVMYRTIVARGLRDECVLMPVLWHRETPIGLLASFIDQTKSRLLFFVSGRNEGFDDVPVGLVLHACNIRWAIEHGIRTYDLLRGDEPYKRSLGATAVEQLRYPLIRTRSGVNLNDALDPGCLADALRMVDEFARRGQATEATTAMYQTLATIAGREPAERLMDALSGDHRVGASGRD